MPDYQMVCYTSYRQDIGKPISSLEFNQTVNELLADGYELYGPPSVISTNKDGETYIVFSQALLKP